MISLSERPIAWRTTVTSLKNTRETASGLTRPRSRRGPASARRPSRLVKSNHHGGARPASRDSHAGRPCAALASGRGPWPRSLGPSPLGRHRLPQPHHSAHPQPSRATSVCRRADATEHTPVATRPMRLLGRPTERVGNDAAESLLVRRVYAHSE